MPAERSLGATRRLALGLERGAASPGALALSGVWARVAGARPGRPLVLPSGIKAVAVGGATLGGSWRTPTAIALAAAIAGRGERVGLVSHGYRGAGVARRVGPLDGPFEAGDEAALAARALGPLGVPVASGRDRAKAAGLLAGEVSWVVLDGLLRPGTEGLASLLCLDGERPFGAGRCPPAGDLRAPPPALLARADHVLSVVDPLGPPARPVDHPSVHLAPLSMRLPAEVGDGRKVALLTALGRPDRLLRALLRRGVEPRAHLGLDDHAGPGAWATAEKALSSLEGCEAVLATEKCALRLPARLAGRPVLVVGLDLDLPRSLIDAVAR